MRTVVLSALLALSTAASAGETVQITMPTGVTVDAEKVTDPAEGTVESAVLTTIAMLTKGEFDAWMNAWCAPSFCPDDAPTREGLKNYNLKAAQKNAGACAHDDGKSLVITRRDGDPASDDKVKLFTFCGENRMPAPISLEKHGDAWKVSSLSF